MITTSINNCNHNNNRKKEMCRKTVALTKHNLVHRCTINYYSASNKNLCISYMTAHNVMMSSRTMIMIATIMMIVLMLITTIIIVS